MANVWRSIHWRTFQRNHPFYNRLFGNFRIRIFSWLNLLPSIECILSTSYGFSSFRFVLLFFQIAPILISFSEIRVFNRKIHIVCIRLCMTDRASHRISDWKIDFQLAMEIEETRRVEENIYNTLCIIHICILCFVHFVRAAIANQNKNLSTMRNGNILNAQTSLQSLAQSSGREEEQNI